MASGSNQPLLSTSGSRQMCKSLLPKCREECPPGASVQGWLLPTWLSEGLAQPLSIQNAWEARAWAEKVA